MLVDTSITGAVLAWLRSLTCRWTCRDAVRRERERVAREFHDTLAQSLADISLRAELLGQSLQGAVKHKEILLQAALKHCCNHSIQIKSVIPCEDPTTMCI